MAPDPRTASASGVHHWGFTQPKDGNRDFECEDSISANPWRHRYAIADGASESFAPRRWSRLLVRAWTSCDAEPQQIDELASGVGIVGERCQRRGALQSAPWYVAEKAQSGSFAAFLGIKLTTKAWEAVAIGDCCIFHEQGHALQCAFPIDDPAGFSNNPILVPSRQEQYESVLPQVVVRQGTWSPGATLTMMSDAMAAWYLRERIAGSRKATLFSSMVSERDVDSLREMIAEERAGRHLRNDDVAILRIVWPGPSRR